MGRCLSEKSRPLNVDRLGFDRILLRLVDLDHRTVNNQRRFCVRQAMIDGVAIGDIEVAMLQRQYVVITG